MNLANIFYEFWSPDVGGQDFVMFKTYHLLPLAIIFALIWLLYINKDNLQRHYSLRGYLGLFIGSLLLFQSALLHFWYVQTGSFTLGESLPLYLCRITIILCGVMCIKGDYKLFEVAYFWGFSGAAVALLTPDTGGFLFPHWFYTSFFMGHGLILISLCFMIFAYEYRPTLKSFRNMIKYSFYYLFAAFAANHLFDGNYSYLKEKPPTASVLDYLPAYPGYVPIIILGMFVLFFLTYIPYYIKDIKERDIVVRRYR